MKARRRRFFWCDSQLDSSTVVHKQRQIVALFGPQARRARTAPKGNTGNTVGYGPDNVQVPAAAAFAGTGRCRLQTVLDGSKTRSRHLAREVCRVVRAAHAGVVRDLWIGTEWPCHVDTVVSDSRCDQSIGCDSGLAPTL